MTNLALTIDTKVYRQFFFALTALVATLILANFGITANQSLALLLSAVVVTIWTFDRTNGIIAGLIFFFVKPLFVRIAYAIDLRIIGEGGYDLLGITPALLLAGLVVWQLFLQLGNGEKIFVGRTRVCLGLFSIVAFLSIFNPANSILVGFGGFERNVLPNMMILLTTSFLFTKERHVNRLLKAMIIVALLSCLYAIGQFIIGVYPWEKEWILNVAFGETNAGWLTVGLRGVEFRLFSFFYNYMDFTFCNVIIFSLVVAVRSTLSPKWKKISGWYVALWIIVLLLTLERMPLIMSFASLSIIYYLKSNRTKRKKILWNSAAIGTVFILTLSLAAPMLENTGAQKLIRLAELANPLSAASIEDRAIRKWEPTLNTIAANPLGVGIGYGSQTRANTVAAKTDFWVEPHNELLQKTLETGIIGGLIFLALLIFVFRDGINLSHSSNSIKRLGIGFAAATVGFWLCGLINVPFSGSSGLLYWALAGVVLSMSERTKISDQTADISNS